MSGQYPPSGSLFVNDKKASDKQPDYNGYLEFDEDTVRSLVDQIKAGETPKCDLSGWKRTSQKTGTTFLSLAAKPPFKRETRDSGGSNFGGGGGRDSGFGGSGGRSAPPRDRDIPF